MYVWLFIYFLQCGGTTHVLRLSWSPDGQYLVSAHAMNNSGPTAQIVERDGWKTNMDFVGHRKAVTVVVRRLSSLVVCFSLWTVATFSLTRGLCLQKFNPKIFKKKQKNGSSPKPGCPYCCCAVGSKDRSLSVWVSLQRTVSRCVEDDSDSASKLQWFLYRVNLPCWCSTWRI